MFQSDFSINVFRLLCINVFIVFFSINITAQTPFTVSTFHNISVYWSPQGGAKEKKVLVSYKKTDETGWHEALPMKYNPIENSGNNPVTGERFDRTDYRGSIVNLEPGTTYDIKLNLEGTNLTEEIQATTWKEDFPVGEIISTEDSNTRLTYTDLNGTAEAYILIDGNGSTIDIQDASAECIRLINSSYIILRNFKLKNAAENGIRLYNSHHIVIENCDISDWGEEDIPGTGFGKNYQAGIYAGTNEAHHCIIQRNKIHHPKWDTNSWAELHDPTADPDIKSNYHPAGPQGIAIGDSYIGNNVIRYNEIWSDSEHYFNDVMGMWTNASYAGFPGPDSDIYGNYIANSYDDGIESEGGNMNVRIWNNYIENVFIAIGNAPTSIGPLYIWRNVSGRADSMPGSVYGQYGGFMKMGYSGSIDWMTGHMYVFNNTILQPEDHGTGGLGTHEEANRPILHCESKNNILQVRSSTKNSISINENNKDNDFDYDLTNRPYPEGQEIHGLSGEPEYMSGAAVFNRNTLTGNFELSLTSLGYDDGVIIPNFTDIITGNAPDMGAHEHGTGDIVYGVEANFSPQILKEIEIEKYKIELFPIPTSKLLHIMNNREGEELEINIYDMSGKKLYSEIFRNNYKIIDVHTFKRGIYFVKILDFNHQLIKTSKIVIN